MSKFTSVFISCFVIITAISAKTFAQYDAGKASLTFSIQRSQSALNSTMLLNNRNEGIANYDYVYTVNLVNGGTKGIKSKIYYDRTMHKSYLLIINDKLPKTDSNYSKKLYVNETIKISRPDYNSYTIRNGLPNDSCWLFKAIEGQINAYSYLSEVGSDFDESSLVALQKDNGEIIPYTHKNVAVLVKDDAKAAEEAYFNRFIKALKIYNKNAKKANTKKE